MIKLLSLSLVLLAVPVCAEEECKHSLTSTCLGLADKTQQAAAGMLVELVETIPFTSVEQYVSTEVKETDAYAAGKYYIAAGLTIGAFQGGTQLMFEAWRLKLAHKAKELQEEAKKAAEESKKLQEANAKKLAEKEARNLAKMRLEAERQAVKDRMKIEGLSQGNHIEDSKLTIEE